MTTSGAVCAAFMAAGAYVCVAERSSGLGWTIHIPGGAAAAAAAGDGMPVAHARGPCGLS